MTRTAWRDGNRTRAVELMSLGQHRWRVIVDDAPIEVTVEPLEGGRFRIVHADGQSLAEVTAAGSRRFVRLDGRDFLLERESAGRRRSAGAATGGLESPMPGLITKVLVGEGDEVRKGQPLVAVEAMKMEHVIRAPRDGRVRRLAAVAGAMVEGGVLLVELDGEAAS